MNDYRVPFLTIKRKNRYNIYVLNWKRLKMRFLNNGFDFNVFVRLQEFLTFHSRLIFHRHTSETPLPGPW